jgi:SPP1 family phage portal protein
MKSLQGLFNKNNEHIKTTRAGKDSAIFGVAYEMMYLEAEVKAKEGDIQTKTFPRFFSVDPREMILLYDQSSEPKKKIAIRYYLISKNHYKVEVIYDNRIELYDRKKEDTDTEWKITPGEIYPHIFGEIPVVAYYLDSSQDSDGIIESVIPLIDAYDVLVSDSMNEFSRFAYAYMVMKDFGLTDQAKKKDPTVVSQMLKFLKRFRLFEWVPKDAEISFLTKEIPTEFIQFMATFLREQIHIQSHVPDFTSEKMAGASGIAIKRLLFDFENVVSTAEAEFDIGLQNRIQLILIALKMNMTAPADWVFDMVSISHKRNIPLDLNETATTAKTMKEAGFSSWLVADVMPDDIIPNVQEELDRQKEEKEQNIPDVFNNPFETEEEEEEE